MNRTATIQNQSMHDMVSFDLVVDGNTLDSSYQVIAISVKKEVNRIPSATIILRDGEAADGDFALSNSGDFIPGKAIEVKIGRDSDNTTVSWESSSSTGSKFASLEKACLLSSAKTNV